jgi:hypothetical protein
MRDYERWLMDRVGAVLAIYDERQISPRESVPRAFDGQHQAEARLLEAMAAEQADDLSP